MLSLTTDAPVKALPSRSCSQCSREFISYNAQWDTCPSCRKIVVLIWKESQRIENLNEGVRETMRKLDEIEYLRRNLEVETETELTAEELDEYERILLSDLQQLRRTLRKFEDTRAGLENCLREQGDKTIHTETT